MANTSNANWRGIYLSESDADHDLRFDYVRYSNAGTGQHLLRYTDPNNRISLDITPTGLALQQVDGGSLTTLDTFSTTVTEDAWYSVRAVLDGANITVWWGALGGNFNEVLSTSSATELTTTTAAHFRAAANTEHGWDNVTLIAGTRSTTQTFTHNDANEQITSTVNGVTTDMTYDEWGRLTERDDGTHTATYAYRYGSKLYSVASDFPGEVNVSFDSGGDGKHRSTVTGASEIWYNYDEGAEVVSTEDDADGSTGALTMTNVVLAPDAQVSMTLGDLAGTTPASGTARYYATDHLGSTRSAWDASKATVGGYEFTPYGSEYRHTGATLASLAGAYTGKPWDATAKLFNFPYRQYSPDMARWTTRDPLGMADGPNVYAYVLARPIQMVDPMGLTIAYDLGNDTQPGNRMQGILECMEYYLEDIIVTGGTRHPGSPHYRDGSPHNDGNAADISRRSGHTPCAIKDAFQKCARGLPNLRSCRLTSTGHVHIDFGTGGPTDCKKWGGYENIDGCEECDAQ